MTPIDISNFKFFPENPYFDFLGTIMEDKKIILLKNTEQTFSKGHLMILFDNMFIQKPVNPSIINYARSLI